MSSELDSNLVNTVEKVKGLFKKWIIKDSFEPYYTHKYKGKSALYEIYTKRSLD